MDMVQDILKYEQGDMNWEQVVAFFQRLIDTGLITHLQGSYQRMARLLVETGQCDVPSRGQDSCDLGQGEKE